MVRLSLRRVSTRDGLRYILANGAIPGSIRVLPCQPVLLTGCAYDLLRVLVDVRVAVFGLSIVVLGFHKSTQDLNGVQFIASDAAKKNFIQSGLPLEGPVRSRFHNGHWKRPVIVAHRNECTPFCLGI